MWEEKPFPTELPGPQPRLAVCSKPRDVQILPHRRLAGKSGPWKSGRQGSPVQGPRRSRGFQNHIRLMGKYTLV